MSEVIQLIFTLTLSLNISSIALDEYAAPRILGFGVLRSNIFYAVLDLLDP